MLGLRTLAAALRWTMMLYLMKTLRIKDVCPYLSSEELLPSGACGAETNVAAIVRLRGGHEARFRADCPQSVASSPPNFKQSFELF